MNKKVAIIILHWNDYDHTYNCIKSIEKLSYRENKIFLVDNNSTDNSLKKLRDAFKTGVSFVELKRNGGFAYGMNKGMSKALDQKFNNIFLLNNDTLLEKNCLEKMLVRLYSDDNIGAVVPMVYQGLKGNTISSFGGNINWKLGESRHTAHMEEDTGKYRAGKTGYIPCSAVLIKSTILEKSGLIPEEYFMYGEDVDWSMKIKAAGYEIWTEPKAIVWHDESASSGSNSPFKTYYYVRNCLIFMQKYAKGSKWQKFLLFFTIKLIKMKIKYFLNLDFKNIYALSRGVFAFWANEKGRSKNY